MELTDFEARLVGQIAEGLPLSLTPYADIAHNLGVSEEVVINSLQSFLDRKIIKRFGLIVRHHELGYTANAMSVFDIPDDLVDELGEKIGELPWVTLCYRRPRRLPHWPYNLFCMIHGKDRDKVEEHVNELRRLCNIEAIPYLVLFSLKRFKQKGARYGR